MSQSKANPDELVGWLQKWTNYLKGYQKRWFILKNGILSYYRNPGEVGHVVRGHINLKEGFVHSDGPHIAVCCGSQSFHLRTSNEVEKKKWLEALELAKVRAIKAESDEEEEMKMDEEAEQAENKQEVNKTVKELQRKLDDLHTVEGLISRHCASLITCLSEVHDDNGAGKTNDKLKNISDRAALVDVTARALMRTCEDFVSTAGKSAKRWQRIMVHEHEQRVELQEQMEALARQHSKLERTVIKDLKLKGTLPPTSPEAVYSDDDADDFHDAVDDVDELISLAEKSKPRSLRRTGSELSSGRDDDEDDYDQHVREKLSLSKSGDMTDRSRSPSPINPPTRQLVKRRSSIPPKPNVGMSLWGIMKNCIGKDLSKIPMPVNFNEPLSMLQRLTEDLEYSSILDTAARIEDSCEQMCYVAAFTISSYSTTTVRTGKPFNPLLGETFECDRTDDMGWRSICEQVSHHPPAAAQKAEGRGWVMYQEFTMSSKFRGKYLSVIPLGISHLDFKDINRNHYLWRKVTTTVHNIIVGKLWVDNHGEMTIENPVSGDKCHLKYTPYSYFSRDVPRKVTGVVQDKNGVTKWILQGTWDDQIECAKVTGQNTTDGKPSFSTDQSKLIWKKNKPLPNSDAIYYFTKLAVQLNEPEEGVAPTDSRNRPDQRYMEEAKFDEANAEKLRLEEQQRVRRKINEAEAEKAVMQGQPFKDYEPTWFTKQRDKWTGNVIHLSKDEYWSAKADHKWKHCPNIF